MQRTRLLNPSIIALAALVLILVGSIATSNGASSTSANTQLTTADGIVQSPGSSQGSAGPQGPAGPRGKRGPRGKTGARGRTGAQGRTGATGARGPVGANGANGLPGTPGADGQPGAAGATGPAGPIGPGTFAQFFALMPPDNAATVAVGAAVDFPQDGPADGITRTTLDTFELPAVGTYRVAFYVSVTEAGQLQLSLNGTPLAYTTVGRATGTSIISGESFVTTTSPNSTISVINPAGNTTALTITPLAGGTNPASASLLIEQLR